LQVNTAQIYVTFAAPKKRFSMTGQQTAPYGTWHSPITPEMVTEAGIRLGEIKTDGPDVYWLEGRPAEGGRNVIVRLAGPNGEPGPFDITPEGYNVRNRVHEYGGAAYGVNDGVVYFSNFADQRIYRHKIGEQPDPVTADPDIPAGDRFADGRFTPDGRFLVCVRERHVEGREAMNEVVAIQVDSGEQTVLASGHDFYSFPRLSPDGTRLAYTAWDHPNMPWDEAELWVAALSPDGASSGAIQVAGGSGESIFQPEWSPDGKLHFVSDRTGWWNLYALEEDTAESVFPGNTESGEPQWVFGQSTYAFLPDGCIALTVGGETGRRLMIIDGDRQARQIELPYTSIGGLVAAGNDVLITAASSAEPAAIVRVDTDTGVVEVVRKSSEIEIDAGLISRPQSITFPTGDGEEAHAYYYPPTNPGFKAPASEMPPVIVLSHGGPTSAAAASFSLDIQFWTSRGFAVTDVNYRGSTGYGRAYRDALKGQWGVVDTEDCINAARHLVDQGLADGHRAIIKGGSAGGYTTLCALVFHDYFAAGASYYGVADAETLATDTHKFESRYLDGLIGPYPEARDLYRQRSPIDYVDQLSCPVIIFQGLEDEIVPPSQAEAMVEALKAKGVPHAYLPFPGEQHGFRIAENIRRTLDAELYFYGKIFGFEPAGEVEPVAIEGLPA
jgi:dipeptidyl aminopeptidase/acylaminoacyl peptidase